MRKAILLFIFLLMLPLAFSLSSLESFSSPDFKDGGEVSYMGITTTVNDAVNVKSVSLSDTKTYTDVLENTNIVYTQNSKGYKEEIIIKSKPSYRTISFNIDIGNYNYNINDRGLLIQEGKLPIGIFYKPHIDNKIFLNYTFDGYTYEIDVSFLENYEGTYPIIIDPTYESLIEGLVGYWKYDNATGDATNTYDSKGINNCTLVNTPTKIETGISNQAYGVTAGSSEHIDCTSTNFPTGGAKSISLWINLSVDAQNGLFIGGWGGTEQAGKDFALLVQTGNKLVLDNYGTEHDTNIVIPLNKWNHIVVAYNTTHTMSYLNGTLLDTWAGANFNSNNLVGFDIGRRPSSGGSYITSQFDEVAVFNKSLNSSDVLDLYNGGDGEFYPFQDLSISSTTIASGTGKSIILSEDSIIGNCTASSLVGSNINYTLRFLKEGQFLTEKNTSNVVSGVTVGALLDDGYTNVGDNITFECIAKISNTDEEGENSSTIMIDDWFLDDCSTYNNVSANYSIKDETNQSLIFVDISGSFNYSRSGSNRTKLYTFSTKENVSNVSVCISPNFVNLITDYTYIYESDVYPSRRFNALGTPFDNLTAQRNLYSLHTDDGIFMRFKTVDTTENIISSVLGTMQKTISSTLTTVETQLTDGSGLLTFFGDPNSDQTFTFSKTDYTTISKVLRPTTAEIYTVVMEGTSTTVNNSIYSGLRYDFFPRDLTLNNNSLVNFSINLSSSVFDLESCVFSILLNNDTVLSSTSGIINTTNCNLGIQLNTANYSQLLARVVVNTNRSEVIYNRLYGVIPSYQGDYSLLTILEDIDRFTDAGFNDRTKNLIAVFIIIILAITIAKGSSSAGIGVAEPTILMIIMSTFFFSWWGWLYATAFNLPSIGALDLNQYMGFVLITLGGVSYLIMKHR